MHVCIQLFAVGGGSEMQKLLQCPYSQIPECPALISVDMSVGNL